MFPKSVQDHSGKVLGPSRHQKTSKGWQNIHLGASGKMFKNWPKTSSFEGFWDLIFSNFPCWRMCCLAAAGETLMTPWAYSVCLKIKTASIGFIFLNFFSQNGAKHSSYTRGYQIFGKKSFCLRFSIWTRGSESFQVVISILMLNFTKLFILAFIFCWIFCTFALFLLMFVKNIAILWEWQQTKSIFWKFIISLRSHTWAYALNQCPNL